MAARGVQAPRRPVTLRDFLELGCDSSSDGFRSYPRRLLPLPPDADADADAVRHLQQQQAPPTPRAEAEAAAAQQLLRRSSSSRSPSSLALALFSSSLPGSGPAGALARISSISRSFSRRIKEGFWRRRDEGDDDDDDDYFDDRDSCGFPSPLVSSCSASDSDESEADVTTATELETPAPERDKATASSSTSPSPSPSSADHDRTRTDAAVADGDKAETAAVEDGDSTTGAPSTVGDKQQQLSPVSVLDFAFDDNDGDEEGSDAGTSCSCSSPAFQFQRCTPPAVDLHGTKPQAQLLHKIRRYDGVAQGIDPVDLDARFTAATSESGESADASTRLATTTSSSSTDTSSSSSSSAETTAPQHDDEEAEHQSAERALSPSPSLHYQADQEEPDDEYRLLARLLEHDAAAAECLDDEVARVLVLDFFAEGADRRLTRSAAAGGRPLHDDRSESLLVRAAAAWLRGAGPRWGIGDVARSGKAALDDMERSRRWMCVGEEECDVAADVECDAVDALVDELVTELAIVLPRWPRCDVAVDDDNVLVD